MSMRAHADVLRFLAFASPGKVRTYLLCATGGLLSQQCGSAMMFAEPKLLAGGPAHRARCLFGRKSYDQPP